MADKTACAYCGKAMNLGQAYCPHCGAPAGPSAEALKKEPAAAAPLGGAAAPPRATRHCSSCGIPGGESDLICTRCGTNLLTGHKVAAAKPAPIPQAVAPPRAKTPLFVVVAAILAAATLLLIIVGAAWFFGDTVGKAAKLGEAGKAAEAIELLRTHLQKTPADAKAQLLLGKLLYEDRQYRPASDAFSAVADLEPGNAEAPLLAALAQHKAKETNGLGREIELLQKSVQRAPASAQTAGLLGLAQGAARDYAAQSASLGAVAKGEGGEVYRAAWAAAEALQGRLDAAKTILSEAGDKPVEGKDTVQAAFAGMEGDTQAIQPLLEAALANNSDAAGMLSARLGALYVTQGEFAKALPLLERAKTGDAGNATAEWLHALCLAGLGQQVEAIGACDAIAKAKGPWAGDAALQSAALYLSIGDLDKSNESVLLAVQLGNDSARLHTVRGRLRMLGGEPDAAAEAYRMAIQKEPNYPAAHLEMGLVHLSQGVLTEGLRELDLFLQTGRTAGGGNAVNEIELLVEQLKQTVQSNG